MRGQLGTAGGWRWGYTNIISVTITTCIIPAHGSPQTPLETKKPDGTRELWHLCMQQPNLRLASFRIFSFLGVLYSILNELIKYEFGSMAARRSFGITCLVAHANGCGISVRRWLVQLMPSPHHCSRIVILSLFCHEWCVVLPSFLALHVAFLGWTFITCVHLVTIFQIVCNVAIRILRNWVQKCQRNA